VLRCGICGTPVPPGFHFCGKCGKPVAAAPVPEEPVPEPKPARAKVVLPAPDGTPSFTFPLREDETTLGSAGEVRVASPLCEPFEGRFVFRGPHLCLVAEPTVNGLFILLKREQNLSLGDELRIGRQLLRLEAMPKPAPSPAPEPVWGSADPGYRVRMVQILAGGVDGDAFPLREGENTVGRSAGDLSFPGDGYVSARHAILTVRGERASVRDLGSSNGTFVRVRGEAFLDPGDLILAGEQLLRVEPP